MMGNQGYSFVFIINNRFCLLFDNLMLNIKRTDMVQYDDSNKLIISTKLLLLKEYRKFWCVFYLKKLCYLQILVFSTRYILLLKQCLFALLFHYTIIIGYRKECCRIYIIITIKTYCLSFLTTKCSLSWNGLQHSITFL